MPESSIAVAMSGGVDSSVVAGMLRARGENVVGLTMQLWNQQRLPELVPEGGTTGRCCSLDDVYDARHVAQLLGIPYYVVNFEDRFEAQVVKPFVEEYLAAPVVMRQPRGLEQEVAHRIVNRLAHSRRSDPSGTVRRHRSKNIAPV